MEETKLVKHNANNYRHWSLRIQGVLEVKGCWKVFDPGFEDGKDITEAERKVDHISKSIFYLSVNDETLDDVIDCNSAKKIRKTLQEIHTNRLLLVRDFRNIKKESPQFIGDYLMKCNAVYNKVKSAGLNSMK